MAESIARRGRRRVRFWAAAAGGLWVVTAAYLLILVFLYLLFLNPPVHALLTGCELGEQARENFAAAIIDWLRALLWWPATLVVAAAGTIWFTLASRRATLRQIQAGLADISAQLERMAAGP
jgi:hypothetical protein